MSFDIYKDKISGASVKDLVEYVDRGVSYTYSSAKKGIDDYNPYAIAAALAELKRTHEFLQEWRKQLER